MINDIRLAATKEQSLDQWIEDTIAVINDIVYGILLEINLVLSEVYDHVR